MASSLLPRSVQSIFSRINPAETSQAASSAWLSDYLPRLDPDCLKGLLQSLGANDVVQDYAHNIQTYLASRSYLENSTLLIALITFLTLLMSWSSRFGSWSGRFSPFGRNPAPEASQVSDGDYSYITSDDLKRAQNRPPSPAESASQRDRDVLLLKCGRTSYPVLFPPHSISRGEVKIGDVRAEAARETGTSNAGRVKLLYKGKTLKDDGRTCRAEGLKEGAEIMCVVGNENDGPPSSSDSEEDGEASMAADGDGAGKRKRVRNKNRKKKGKKQSSTPGSGAANASVPGPSTPLTPLDKLDAVGRTLHGLLPECVKFTSNPPEDRSKKEYEHKRLSETILAQVLLKLDAVETEGDPDARARRRELVQETQQILNGLDEAVKLH